MSQSIPKSVLRGLTWMNRPTKPEKVFYPLLYPRAGQTIDVAITNHQLAGILTHWWQGRTQPCTAGIGFCEGCENGRGQRWKGYLGAVSLRTGRQVICEVTRFAFEACPELQEPAQDLRGRHAEIWRKGNSKQSPLCIKITPAPRDVILPPPLDLEEALTRIWGRAGFGHHTDD